MTQFPAKSRIANKKAPLRPAKQSHCAIRHKTDPVSQTTSNGH